MASTYVSRPVFLNSTGTNVIYTCPANKTSIIKNIIIANESGADLRVNMVWRDVNSIGAGSTINEGGTVPYTLVLSGTVPAHGRMRVLDDFLSINAGDKIEATPQYTGALNVLISALEQEMD
jgi:hypothetical protein